MTRPGQPSSGRGNVSAVSVIAMLPQHTAPLYTISTLYLHTIYTPSTLYHTIYTISINIYENYLHNTYKRINDLHIIYTVKTIL